MKRNKIPNHGDKWRNQEGLKGLQLPFAKSLRNITPKFKGLYNPTNSKPPPPPEDQRQVSVNSLYLASRGCSDKTLLNCQFLLSDPDLVWKTEEHWPYGYVPLPLLTVRDRQRQDECFVFCTDPSFEKLTLYFTWFIFFKLLKVVIWILKYI